MRKVFVKHLKNLNNGMTHHPKVSIGFTVYNGAERMCPALESLLNQTYADFELIISDNASTDATPEICKEYAARDHRIRYIRQPQNIGQVPNFVAVLRAAQGGYFMWAADDDTRDPHFIEELVHALDENPNHHIAMCSYQSIYEDGVIKNTVLMKEKNHLTDDGHFSLYRKIIFNKPIHHFLHGLHRAEFVRKFFERPIPECIRWDRVFMAEYALAGKFYSIESVLFFKRETRIPGAVRYQNDMVGAKFRDPLAYTKYYWLLLWRPLTSSIVPLQRKIVAPFIWVGLVRRYRQSLVTEWKRALRAPFV